jgi:hypothetical protein
MITRDGNRLIIELPDSTKAEALEWLLNLFLQTPLPSPSTNLHQSVRMSETHLANLELDRMVKRAEQKGAERLVQTNRGPTLPWRETPPKR